MAWRLFCAALCILAACPARAQTILPLDDYRRVVRKLRTTADAGLSPADARALRARLRPIARVRYPDGQQVATDNRALLRDLDTVAAGRPASGKAADKGVRAARERVQARLRTLQSVLEATPSPPTERDPQQQARAILAADEFRRAAVEAPPKNWWDRMWERIGKFFTDILEWLFGRRGPSVGDGALIGRVLLFFLYFAAGVAALVAIYWLVSVVRDRQVRRARARSGGLLDLDADDLPDPLAAARTQAAAGDYRAAVRLAYIASLRRLQAAGLLVPAPNKTNWEYQRDLRSRSRDAYDTLLPATRAFDRIWYGHARATAGDYERIVQIHDALPAPPPDVAKPAAKAAVAAGRPADRAGKDNPW